MSLSRSLHGGLNIIMAWLNSLRCQLMSKKLKLLHWKMHLFLFGFQPASCRRGKPCLRRASCSSVVQLKLSTSSWIDWQWCLLCPKEYSSLYFEKPEQWKPAQNILWTGRDFHESRTQWGPRSPLSGSASGTLTRGPTGWRCGCQKAGEGARLDTEEDVNWEQQRCLICGSGLWCIIALDHPGVLQLCRLYRNFVMHCKSYPS